MTPPAPTSQPHLPRPAVNLALRVLQLYRLDNGRRCNIEIIFNDREWILIVDGNNVENLGIIDD